MSEYEMILKNLLKKEISDQPTKNKYQYWIQCAAPSTKSFMSNEKTGKWLITLNNEQIDEAWNKVKQGCANEDFVLAKSSTQRNADRYGSHLICVYTNDWSNIEDVNRVRKSLYDLGFTEPLKYKRDIETINRVYDTDKEFYIIETQEDLRVFKMKAKKKI